MGIYTHIEELKDLMYDVMGIEEEISDIWDDAKYKVRKLSNERDIILAKIEKKLDNLNP